MNSDRVKHKLAEVESEIKALAGDDIDHSDRWTSCPEQRTKVRSLLDSRRDILNEMFLLSDENMLRFKAVNERFLTLTRQLHDRIKALESKLSPVMDCQDFDDDYELEGTLRYCFNSEDSVLKLEDDCEYDSDFTLKLIFTDFAMTVKELFQSLDFKDIIEPMKKKYPTALLPLSRYKEDYDIILNTVFSGEGGTITFRSDGDSNAYLCEGDRYFNIVGMEVSLPVNGAVTAAEAAAEILWCSAPFGRYGEIDWGDVADWPEEFEPGEPRLELALLEAKIGPLPEWIKQSLLSSSSIEKVYYESQTYGKSDRIDYIADLLLNPLYNSKKYLNPNKKQECICVLYTTPEQPCTTAEQNRIIEIIGKYFGDTPWQLFTRQCKGLSREAELDITYITGCV